MERWQREHFVVAVIGGLLPSENKRDLGDVPDEELNKLQPAFYTDPINAAIKAMALE